MHTIAPTSALPAIPDPVVIDGYTQPGASPNTLAVGDNAVLLIDLSGAAAGIGVDGLVISAGGSTVRGLIINDFVAGPIITPGFIPNGGKGISLGSAGGNTIVGNFIGTDASGGIARPNTFSGVLATTAGNQIGGTAPGDRNVISGNNVGVFFLNAGASGNLLQGNYIGVNAAGTADLGNTNVGVQINNAPGNTIGQTASNMFNVSTVTGVRQVHSIGGAASDTVNVMSTAIGSTLNVDSGGGANLVNVGNGNIAANIKGSVSVKDAGGTTTLNLYYSADTTGQVFNITGTQVTGTALVNPISFSGGGITSLGILGGSGDDTVNVNSIAECHAAPCALFTHLL